MPGHGSALGRIRTFALIASLTVVAAHLLPHAVGSVGPAALLVLLFGLALPSWGEKLVRALIPRERAAVERGWSRPRIALELGYAGLIVHHLGDGVALWNYSATPDAGIDVVVALAAHTVPVIAVVVLEFKEARGSAAALVRAAGLALATLAGCAAAARLPAASLAEASPWVAAFVSGLLVHVITHDLEQDPPKSRRARAADLAAAALGLAVPLAIGAEIDAATRDALLRLTLLSAPALLVGLALSAGLDALDLTGRALARAPAREGGGALSAFSRAAKGVLRAALTPTAAVSALASTHETEAEAPAQSFAAPALGLETLLVGAALLGARTALFRLAASLIAAIAAAAAFELASSPGARSEAHGSAAAVARPKPPRSEARSPIAALDALVRHAVPWMAIGLLTAAGLLGSPRSEGLALLDRPAVAIAAISLLALPGYLSGAASAALGAVLLVRGAPATAVIAGLLLAPMISVRFLQAFERPRRRRAGIAGLAALLVAAAALGVFGGLESSIAKDAAVALAAEPAGALAYAAAGALALLSLRGMWKLGARSWIAGLGIHEERIEA